MWVLWPHSGGMPVAGIATPGELVVAWVCLKDRNGVERCSL